MKFNAKDVYYQGFVTYPEGDTYSSPTFGKKKDALQWISQINERHPNSTTRLTKHTIETL